MPETPPSRAAWLRRNGLRGEREQGMAITERQVLDALHGVRDPDKGADIVSLGMVSGMVVRQGNVGFAIEVEPERGPRLEPLRKAAEQAVEIVPGVLSVTAVLTAETRSAPRPAPQAPAHSHGQ